MTDLRLVTDSPTPPPVTAGAGVMSACCAGFDWSRTPLGRAADWSPELRTASALVLAAPFASLLLWGDDLCQLYNDAYLPLLGDRHPSSLGQPTHDCWASLASRTGPIYDRVRDGHSVVVEHEAHRVMREGQEDDAWFTVGYTPVRASDGSVAGIQVTMFETTAQVLAQRTAEAATRAKGDFLTVMSHELRTPLNAIGGYAELLELGVRGPVTPEQRDDLTRIQGSQRHLLEIINGVLSYAKVEAGALHYAVEDVVMDELLSRCEALVATQLREAGIELHHDRCRTRLAARADGEKVQQIVLNLLNNAAKFTAPGGHVTLSCAAEQDKRLVVHVTDTGCGIAPGDLECIFQPFVQVDAKMTRAHEGTGLGLAISRRMARGMGGDLTVRSTVGKGSTFILTLACGRIDGGPSASSRRDGEGS